MTKHHVAMTVSSSIQTLYCQRTSLTVLKASGKSIRKYLQGQITQDIDLLTPEHPIYTAVLSPQGKMIADMHIIDIGNELIIISATSHAPALVERLRRFALGHDIRLGRVESLGVLSIQGEQAKQMVQQIKQPVEAEMEIHEAANQGVWLVMDLADIQDALDHIPAGNQSPCDENTLESAAIIYGTPRFGRDWDASIHPLNANLIEMNGVSFDKGCYTGQEITSRMNWRGGIKKKLYHVQIHGDVPATPCPIQTTANIGKLTAAATDTNNQHFGIAHLPIEIVERHAPLSLENGATLSILKVCHA